MENSDAGRPRQAMRGSDAGGRPIYPFAALVGQEELKTALILNVIEPRIGGVLIRGEKGTAKSTAVRALAALLPVHEAIAGCSFGCTPSGRASQDPLCSMCQERRTRGETLSVTVRHTRVVELPLGTTEDRLIGTLDLEHALARGEKRFEPGLLADAHRNFLYVDEVNLLEDHLVDLLLDSAAMGVNTVEREGVSFSHPSRFVLVGTMNPEEGELRPQLIDRFGLCAHVVALSTVAERIELLRRLEAFEADPRAFCERWKTDQEELEQRIESARARIASVTVPDECLAAIVGLANTLGLEGHRGEIVLMRATRARSALFDRSVVEPSDVRAVAPLALAHRMARQPFDDPAAGHERLTRALENLE